MVHFDLGFADFFVRSILDAAAQLTDKAERDAFTHVTGEARRVLNSVRAISSGNLRYFGELLYESHLSLRDRLRVSLAEVDALVDAALQAGAVGARLTGAGFGGCVVCLCTADTVEAVRSELLRTYYHDRGPLDPAKHLFIAEPSDGALLPKALNNADQH